MGFGVDILAGRHYPRGTLSHPRLRVIPDVRWHDGISGPLRSLISSGTSLFPVYRYALLPRDAARMRPASLCHGVGRLRPASSCR